MDIPALISSVSSLANLGGLLVKERDSQKAAAIQIEFSNKIIEAQAKLSEVLGAVIEQQRLIPVLEQRIRELEAQAAEKGRYVLTKLGAEREFFAYRPCPSTELEQGSGEVEYFVCQPCFEAGKKSVLNRNGDSYLWCPVCKHGAYLDKSGSAIVSSSRRRSNLLDGY